MARRSDIESDEAAKKAKLKTMLVQA